MYAVSVGTATDNNQPLTFGLAPAWPNPFNPVTNLNYSIEESGHVKLAIYDITGRQVSQLVNENQNAGEHHLTWQADQFASGIYFVRLQADGKTQRQKLLLLK